MATATKRFDSALEYQALREEMLSAKKFVFERPLLIVTVAIAGLKLLDVKYLFILPLSISLLLLFNFWFTINRLISVARIIAYIQLELEEEAIGSWIGWETCLRFYRMWLNTTPNYKAVVDEKIDMKSIPSAFTFYPPIYYFHAATVLLTVIGSITIALSQENIINSLCAFITFFVGCVSVCYFIKYNTGAMRILIERNRVIWSIVFDQIKVLGKK